MRDRVMDVEILGTNLGGRQAVGSWLPFLEARRVYTSFGGYEVHVDNFIRWRLRSDLAEFKGCFWSYDSCRYLCIADGCDDEDN